MNTWKDELKKKWYLHTTSINNKLLSFTTCEEEVIEFIESLLKEQTQWISVKDKLPEEILRVIVFTNTGRMGIGYYYRGEWHEDAKFGTFSHFGYEVIFWMPLPPPPEGDK